jgi:hypothetical protein
LSDHAFQSQDWATDDRLEPSQAAAPSLGFSPAASTDPILLSDMAFAPPITARDYAVQSTRAKRDTESLRRTQVAAIRPVSRPPMMLARYERVPDRELDKLRGGFITPNGFVRVGIDLQGSIEGVDVPRIEFSAQIERDTRNGTNSVVINDDPANGVRITFNEAQGRFQSVVQQGGGNGISLNSFDNAKGMFFTIQNSLSNVTIQQRVGINIETNLLNTSSPAMLRRSLEAAQMLGLK